MASHAQISWHCRYCQRRTLHSKERFGCGMGLLLTLLTTGLFLPIWLLIDVLGVLRPYKCQTCGRSKW